MLHLASFDGEIKLFKDLCRHKAWQTERLIKLYNHKKQSIFHCAAENGKSRMIREFMRKLPYILGQWSGF